MKNLMAASAVWFLVTAVTWGIIYLHPDEVVGLLMFPGSVWEIAFARTALFALPCAIAAGITFFLGSTSRPSASTLLTTCLVAFASMAVGMTVAGICLWALGQPDLDTPAWRVAALGISFLIGGYILTPVYSPGRDGVFLWRPWLRPLLAMLLLAIALTGLSMTGSAPLTERIANIAAASGGHYYTFLNFAGPAIQTGCAIAIAAQLGIAWANALNRHQF